MGGLAQRLMTAGRLEEKRGNSVTQSSCSLSHRGECHQTHCLAGRSDSTTTGAQELEETCSLFITARAIYCCAAAALGSTLSDQGPKIPPRHLGSCSLKHCQKQKKYCFLLPPAFQAPISASHWQWEHGRNLASPSCKGIWEM